jgi:hypothetical protein
MYDIVVIDDERTFTGNGQLYFRNSDDGITFLAKQLIHQKMHYGEPIRELWLDHDLGRDDDICPVVDFLMLVDLEIERIYVHSQNPTVDWIVQVLRKKYDVSRSTLPELKD